MVVSRNNFYLFEPQGKNTLVPKEITGSCSINGISSIVTHSNCDTLVTIVGPSSLVAGGTGKILVDLILRFYTPEDASWL